MFTDDFPIILQDRSDTSPGPSGPVPGGQQPPPPPPSFNGAVVRWAVPRDVALHGGWDAQRIAETLGVLKGAWEGIEVGFRMEDLSKQSGDLLGLDGI